MKKYFFYTLLFSLAIFLLEACQNASPVDDGHTHTHAEGEAHAHAAEDAHAEEEITLTAIQMKNIGLKMGVMEQRNLSSVLRPNGLLELPPDQKAAVSSKLAGNIQSVRVHVGNEVRKGAVLAYIESPELIRKQESFLKNKADIGYLEKEIARQEELVKLESGAKKQLEKVLSEMEIKLAEQQSLEAQFKLLNLNPPDGKEPLSSLLPVRAPITGMVQMVHKNLGEYVEPNTPIFIIADNRHLHAEIHLFEKDLPYIKKGQRIEFFLQSAPKDIHKAEIFAVGSVMNKSTRAVNLHAEVDNPDGKLLPGMYVEVRIPIGEETATCLPAEAITSDKGLNYIFVQEHVHDDDGDITFRKVQVVAATTDAGYTAVQPMETMEKNAKIVTEGAFFLLAESKKGEEGAGHHH